MWMFTVYGFFSVTSYLQSKKDELMIRARSKNHLERLKNRFTELKKFEIQTWIGRDYLYRLIVPKSVWTPLVVKMVEETTWSNFKDETGKRFGHHSKYLTALHRIWGLMFQSYALQRPKAEREVVLHPDDLLELQEDNNSLFSDLQSLGELEEEDSREE